MLSAGKMRAGHTCCCQHTQGKAAPAGTAHVGPSTKFGKQAHAAHIAGQSAASSRAHSTSNQDGELGVPAVSVRRRSMAYRPWFDSQLIDQLVLAKLEELVLANEM